MKRSFLLLLFVAFPMCLCARPNQSSQPTNQIKQGEALFQQHCFLCHGTAGVGVFGNKYAPRLSKETMVSEGFVRKQVMDGGELMPAFKYTLQPSQISLIIGYLKTVEPAQPAQ